MKYYFFRDIDNEINLSEGKTYHAAGYVEELFLAELGINTKEEIELAYGAKKNHRAIKKVQSQAITYT